MIEEIRRYRQPSFKLCLFLGHVEAIESIKIREFKAAIGKTMLPFLAIYDRRIRLRGFNHDDPWTYPIQIKTFKNFILGAFHIDFEEMDRGCSRILEDLR